MGIGLTQKHVWHARKWLPIIILALFAIGVTFTLIVHAQEPTALSNHIEIEGVRRDVDRLGDLPAQFSAMRERQIRLETVQLEQGRQLDGIASLEKWLALGVFGMLGTQLLQKIKLFGRDDNNPQSGSGIPLIKIG